MPENRKIREEDECITVKTLFMTVLQNDSYG